MFFLIFSANSYRFVLCFTSYLEQIGNKNVSEVIFALTGGGNFPHLGVRKISGNMVLGGAVLVLFGGWEIRMATGLDSQDSAS